MTDDSIREPTQIREDCYRKLRSVETGPILTAVLGCLLQEDWTTPRIEELRLTPDGCLLGRLEGEPSFKAFVGAEADLIRNIHGVAKVAELDGDEIGYLLGEIARLKRIE
jgi:hypothetical protein